MSTTEECIEKHIKKTKCDGGFKALATSCNKLYGKDKVVGSARDHYECVIDEEIFLESDSAVRFTAKRCYDKNK